MKSALAAAGLLILLSAAPAICAEAPVSDATAECLDCHSSFQPGIVADWKHSRHAAVTPGEAMKVEGLARKVSSDTVPENLQGTAVGCAECHMLRPDAHADTFEHNGYEIHVVVSPDDCKTCHSTEAGQYEKNLMSHARKNLAENPVYHQLQESILADPSFDNGRVTMTASDADTRAEACYYCHGTRLTVTGTEIRDTMAAGELEFPVIDGWPNQGVGRINLDGSRGACTACHTRHRFSIEMARKPYTCKECHIGPDVPVYKVYSASKHGNLFSTHEKEWNFTKVPWTVGEDFTAPTCATCHISLLVDPWAVQIAPRSHQMNDRLPWRLFGLIYAHPYPKQPDTTIIRNKDGQPLPSDFAGGFASDFLIDKDEQERRTLAFQQTCLACHDTSWVTGFWRRFENTVKRTNTATLAATRIMQEIWQKGHADAGNPFDEAPERMWSDQWLFYANTVRFAS
ncbi:MAG: multiheme c-type cytochrome, partial [Desulfobacterales bacterium]